MPTGVKLIGFGIVIELISIFIAKRNPIGIILGAFVIVIGILVNVWHYTTEKKDNHDQDKSHS